MKEMKHYCIIGIAVLMIIMSCSKKPESLVPKKPSKAPDYFCTWNIQGYVCSQQSSAGSRMAMTEANMFGDSTYQNWVSFYPKIREDLIFVMDDSWDIPINETSKDGPTFGLTELNEERFPSFTGTPAKRLSKLVDALKAKGWKGLGGWICAQEAPIAGKVDTVEYWTERLKAANDSGFSYWKVDWGKQSRNMEWRRMLTDLGRTYAPNLVIEHAFNGEPIEFSDTYRTYDVGSMSYCVDSLSLNDYWVLQENETWLKSRHVGDTIRESAPARVSRGLPLANVINPDSNQPFVLSSMYPNGAVAIVTIGRGLNHEYITERVNVEQNIESIENPIGIFGDYESLTLILPEKIKGSDYTVLGQDLAGDSPLEITKDITFENNRIIISGDVIRRIGLSAASKGDLSDPGLVLKFER